jgi:hypothetical protein
MNGIFHDLEAFDVFFLFFSGILKRYYGAMNEQK